MFYAALTCRDSFIKKKITVYMFDSQSPVIYRQASSKTPGKSLNASAYERLSRPFSRFLTWAWDNFCDKTQEVILRFMS